MARTLILMRHAKSAWDDPTQDDFDRPLNDRGRASAPAIGAWLARKGYLPDVVVVSGARRTVETWERLAQFMPSEVTLESKRALYLAEPLVILGALRQQSAETVMMIGHNPGFAILARALSWRAPEHPKFGDYPTAATAVLRFDVERWADAQEGTGELLDFAVPRDLLESD